ncbi:MAG: carboxymuconolactone decarboxylase family protein [Gammaproteobacteria bacterium]|nr:carboxymuconolactone decarboxylase family protein [Gammaproteobacteria bacterium]
MAHIKPRDRSEVPDLEAQFAQFESMAGFVPNSLLTMAHHPPILRGYMQLGHAVMNTGTVDAGLKRLVALVASTAAGCRYCQGHMATFAAFSGSSPEALERVWRFEFDTDFSPAEKAALRLARDAAQVPNAVEAEHFVDLSPHFTDAQIVELVGVIAMFGFLNRWNDTMATTLEALPMKAASQGIGKSGWTAGKHVAEDSAPAAPASPDSKRN